MPVVQPLWRCELAAASNPLDVAQVWTELVDANGNSLLQAFDSHRGRQHVLSSIPPGTGTFTFLGIGRELDPTNAASPYYPNVDINKQIRLGAMVNLLSVAQAIISGGWTAGANTNALTFPASAMTLTATGAGAISASTPAGASGFRCQAGRVYNFTLTAKTAATIRAFTLTVTWYTAAGAIIGTQAVGSSDSVGGVTLAGSYTASPSNAAYASLTYSVAGCAGGEVHSLTQVALLDSSIVGGATAWLAGGPQPRFTGFIDSIAPVWQASKLTSIRITATDTLRILAQTQFPADPFVTRAIQNGATALWPLDDPAGSLMAREVIGGAAARPGMWPLGSSAAGFVFGSSPRASAVSTTTLASAPSIALNGIPDSLQPAGAGAWAVEIWVKTVDVVTWSALYNQGVGVNDGIGLGLVRPSGTSLVPWLNVTHGGASLTIQGTRVVNDGQWHLVTALFDGTTYCIYVDGVLDVSQAHAAIDPASPGTLFGALTGSLSCATIYKNGMTDMSAGAIRKNYQTGSQWFGTPEKSGTRLASALSLIGFPSSLYAGPGSGSDMGQSNIAAPTSPPSTVKSYLDAVALAEDGMIFARPDGVVILLDRLHQINITPTVTFGDAAGEIPYKVRPDLAKDNVDLYTASTVTMAGGTPQTWAPGTNETQYGVKSSLSESGLISAGGDTEALARGQYNVSRFNTPQQRWRSFVCDALSSASTLDYGLLVHQPIQLVEIGQQATVNLRQWTGSTWSAPLSTSVAMIEGLDEHIDLQQWTVTVHVAPADTQAYWILGTSALGTNTRLMW